MGDEQKDRDSAEEAKKPAKKQDYLAQAEGFGLLDVIEGDDDMAEARPIWLVEGVLMSGDLSVIVGSQKTIKTSLWVAP